MESLTEEKTLLRARLQSASTAVNTTKQFVTSLDHATSQLDEVQRYASARLQTRLEEEVRALEWQCLPVQGQCHHLFSTAVITVCAKKGLALPQARSAGDVNRAILLND